MVLKVWSLSTGEGNGKALQYSFLENPMNSMKRQKDVTLKDELPRLIGAQYATEKKRRNSSRKNGQAKVWCYKGQYCIGTWNARSMNQAKLEVIKQEMPRLNIDILGISELKWTGMHEFNSDDHYIYYCGQESLRRKGVAIIVNKRIKNSVLGCHFALRYSWLTMLWQFQVNSKGIQPYIHADSWEFGIDMYKLIGWV